MAHSAHVTSLAVAVAALALGSVACTVEGDPRATVDKQLSEGPAVIRQTDDSGRRLPFTTPFPERWSSNNDGTTYEPCTALDDGELIAAGIDPASVSDVALSNHQTIRGCKWDHLGVENSGLSQFAGDNPTFEAQKRDRNWYRASWDIQIDGRLTMVDSRDKYTCMTTVKSGQSPVSTLVIRILNPPPTKELCALAIDFTRRTIPKMEPPAP